MKAPPGGSDVGGNREMPEPANTTSSLDLKDSRSSEGTPSRRFDQVLGIEGFRHVLDDSKGVAARNVGLLGACGQQHDGDVGKLRGLSKALADLPAIDARHHDVEHDEVGVLDLCFQERLPSVQRGFDLEALQAEVHLEQPDDHGVVVDEQNALRHAARIPAGVAGPETGGCYTRVAGPP